MKSKLYFFVKDLDHHQFMDACYNNGQSPLYVILTFNPNFGHGEEAKKKRSNQQTEGSRLQSQDEEDAGEAVSDITDQRPLHWRYSLYVINQILRPRQF